MQFVSQEMIALVEYLKTSMTCLPTMAISMAFFLLFCEKGCFACMCICCNTGADNYMKQVNWDIWNLAACEMATNPKVVDETFYAVCHQFVLNELGLDLNNDITETSAFYIYAYLINHLQ